MRPSVLILTAVDDPKRFRGSGVGAVLLDGLERRDVRWCLHVPWRPRDDLDRFSAALSWPYWLREHHFLSSCRAFEATCEGAGLPVVNSLKRFSLRHSTSYGLWARAQIPCPRYQHIREPADIALPYPLILRTDGIHRGRNMYLVHNVAEAEAAFRTSAVLSSFPPIDLAIEFVDTRHPDGMYRKRRAHVIGRRLLPRQLTVSPDWKVKLHSGTPAGVEEDRRFVERGEEDADLVMRAARVLGSDIVALDYCRVPDGRYVFWEGNRNFALSTGGSMLRRFAAATGRTFEESLGTLDAIGLAFADLVLDRIADGRPDATPLAAGGDRCMQPRGGRTQIHLVSAVPGPASAALREESREAVARPVCPIGEVAVRRGRGALLEDLDGNRYIDLIGGYGCLIAGHGHRRIVAAVQAQAEHFLHTDFSVIPYPGYVTVARAVAARCVGDRKVAFFNSGAEAVENAVKVARAVTGRSAVVCFEGAFHGRTYMALTLTSNQVPHKLGFGPFVPEVYRVPYPGYAGATTADFTWAIGRLVSERQVAAVVVEPVLGEGGFVIPPAGFLAEVAETCRRAGAVMIADEVQCGYGRTGRFLACHHAGVDPDLIVLGKSIASGLPLSAVAGRSSLMDALEPNALGGTYVGNPLALAAAAAVLEVIDDEGLLQRAQIIGDRVCSQWASSRAVRHGLATVRGLGAMVGIEFVDPDLAGALVRMARMNGVLAVTGGPRQGVLRYLAPLVIQDEQLDEAFEVFDDCLGRLTR